MTTMEAMTTGGPTVPAHQATLGLRLGRSRVLVEVGSYAEASALYARLRDEGGHGASTMPRGWIYHGGKLVAEVSYNGRVWQGDACVYDPSGVGA